MPHRDAGALTTFVCPCACLRGFTNATDHAIQQIASSTRATICRVWRFIRSPLPAKRSKQPLVFFAQGGLLQQIGAIRQRLAQLLLASPAPNLLVVAV